MTHLWTERPRPLRLERRLEFPDYAATRSFLDGVEASCERAGVYPDISFGRTYASLVLRPEGDTIDEALHRLAAELDSLVPQAGAAPTVRAGAAVA